MRLVDLGSAKRVYQKTYTRCGTTEYLAPEILLHKGYTRGVDLWSLGVLVYEMFNKRSPFFSSSPNFIYKNIIAGEIRFYDSFPKEPKDLISKLIVRKPNERLGMGGRCVDEIMEHPWLNGFDWVKLERKKLRSPWVPKFDSVVDTRYFFGLEEDHVEKFKRKKNREYAWDEGF